MDPKSITAFPASYYTDDGEWAKRDGMTLRDYFAAKSIPIMWDAYDKGYCGLNGKDEPNIKIIAEGAYQLADAMLAARG